MYHKVHVVKDDRFNVDELENYSLSILIGYTDLQVCIIDTRSNQCMIVEDFTFEIDSEKGLIDTIAKIFDEHHLLKAGFWHSVKVAVKNQKFSLVPTSVFQSTNLEKYLDLLSVIDPDDELHYYKHIQSDCVTVFAINKELASWIREAYPSQTVQFVHQSCALTEGVLRYDDHTPEETLFLSIGRNYCQVIISRNRELLFYNRFQTPNSTDLLKYVMQVMVQKELSQNRTKVIIWGQLDARDDSFSDLYKHIRNISFGDRPKYLKWNYAFDVLREHNYFDLYNLFLCA